MTTSAALKDRWPNKVADQVSFPLCNFNVDLAADFRGISALIDFVRTSSSPRERILISLPVEGAINYAAAGDRHVDLDLRGSKRS